MEGEKKKMFLNLALTSSVALKPSYVTISFVFFLYVCVSYFHPIHAIPIGDWFFHPNPLLYYRKSYTHVENVSKKKWKIQTLMFSLLWEDADFRPKYFLVPLFFGILFFDSYTRLSINCSQSWNHFNKGSDQIKSKMDIRNKNKE